MVRMLQAEKTMKPEAISSRTNHIYDIVVYEFVLDLLWIDAYFPKS